MNILITGTDTDIGKTFVSRAIALSFLNKGLKVGYFKPFQSGAYLNNGQLIAPDVFELEKINGLKTAYSYLLEGEVSPYLASLLNNVQIDINKTKKDIFEFSKELDLTVIEGAGGLLCPIKKNYIYADFAFDLNLPIVIVTTPDLGRINHTLMTLQCAKDRGLNIKGLIINKMPKNPTTAQENFIFELSSFTNEKILSIIPEDKSFECLDIEF
ncbi:dethiobiotin synthase [bacterium]|nr:dethiobiotin synthase [bacterium]